LSATINIGIQALITCQFSAIFCIIIPEILEITFVFSIITQAELFHHCASVIFVSISFKEACFFACIAFNPAYASFN
jgi:hypothetical protein